MHMNFCASLTNLYINKRQSMTACGSCIYFVEYCSNKAVSVYEMQRGKQTALVNAKIVTKVVLG